PISNVDKTLGIKKTDLAAHALTLPFDHVAGQQLANDAEILTHRCKPHRPQPDRIARSETGTYTENNPAGRELVERRESIGRDRRDAVGRHHDSHAELYSGGFIRCESHRDENVRR